ncbi:MAG: hypothetical protein PHT69_12005 [Bacteroidales bacterium]|nr:hypothetical protein [Bacteroidales bacterium]
MMKKFLLLCLPILLLSSHLRAQRTTNFPTEHVAFFTELTAFFESVEDRDARRTGKLLIEAFTPVWTNFNEAKKNIVIANCNRMIDRKMRPFPQFETYLTTLINFSNSNQPDNNFVVFHNVLEELINRSRGRHFMGFLDFCKSLFSENALYSSPTTKWTSDNAVMEFKVEEEPYVIINSLNLTCYANNDSSIIYNTKGVYYPMENLWKGEGGIISWERAGFERHMVWAEIGKYEINLQFSRFDIDSVTFYNKNFFDEPLFGVLNERVLANVSQEEASYPRFTSYDLRLRIENIFEDINYEGGFSMHGSKLIGSGDRDTDAYLIFKRENQDFIIAGSSSYSIASNKISSADANITIYMEDDSIYHPSIQLRYNDETKEVSLFRNREGLSNSPFFNSFHKLDMYFEALYWNMKEPKIDLRMIKGVGTESTALFESSNFFSEHRFERIQALDDINPLVVIYNYTRRIQSNEFHLTDIASFMRISLEQTKILMINLTNMGFLMYDLDYDKIIVKDRLVQYVNSKARRVDYDVLQFNSIVNDGVNASINLLNFDLNLRGVESVFLSDSQNVVIFPKDQALTVKKNRDFAFDGKVNAGLFEYYGKLFYFDYEIFKINMPVIDSLLFRVFDKTKERDAYGRYPLVKIKSVIEDMAGELLIDFPTNKSGIQPFDEYPIFHSKKDAFVYYNKSHIHNGVYTKDRFYFHLETFTIDSLNTFSTEGLEFKGYLSSADIFPDIYEPLKVQPDFSLGFIMRTPENGYPAYNGKGIYKDLINLSNKGLIGHGTLEYLTSISKSANFYFFPDSMRAKVEDFVIQEQIAAVEYPDVLGKDVDELWLPYQDRMIITKIDNAIEMYKNQSKLHGYLTLTPSLLSGEGTMEFNDAEMDSRLFKFKNTVFDADTADFRLKTYDLSELAFSTENYKSHIDFVARKGEFKSNGGGSKVEFPVNQYICYMDEFDWYMDREEIDLAVDVGDQMRELEGKTLQEIADIDISGSEFISVHPNQDSLRFVSPRAKYNLRNNTIFAEDVKIIRVADAAIFPGDGLVTIYRDARMETLREAQVLANMATRYHTLYNATVNITSRKKYEGRAYYDYLDESGNKQLIVFEQLDVDTTAQTFANGLIAKDADFMLSPNFEYYGAVSLVASKEFLIFDGAFRIKSNCDTNALYWAKFTADINPLDIYIPIGAELLDENDKQLYASIMQSNDTVYSAFLAPKLRTTDRPLISSQGYLYFDKERRQYKIASIEKLRQFNLPGNYISLDIENCYSYAEGKIELSNNLGQVKFDIYGNVELDIATGLTQLDVMILLDFFFAENAMKMVNDNIEKYADLAGVDISRESYSKSLTELLGIEDADRIISDLNLVGRIRGRFPNELQKTFVLNHVRLVWNSETETYQSEGKIGIGNMQRTLINKYIDGYLELVQRRGGDILHFYINLDTDDWFYFGYQNRVMQAFSCNREFVTIITETKPQNRKLDTERGETPYSYYISSERRVKDFLKKFIGEEEEEGEGTEQEETPNGD